MKIAQVLVFRGVSGTYSYLATEDHQVGQSIEVSFGNYLVKGVIISLSETENTFKTIKPITSVLNIKPLSRTLIELVVWFTAHYQVTPYKAFQTIIGAYYDKKVSAQSPSVKSIPFATPYPLTTDQTQAIHTLLTHPEAPSFYLHGITSSGKTELYIQLAHHYLQLNKHVLILVPEIALTPQYSEHFQTRFGDQVSIIHSGLTAKQRKEQWHRISSGLAPIVIGPRSAVFAPLDSLGIIIIDEEHEPSYKQDTHPRYTTHSIAQFRAAQHNAPLLYGSATPSVCTYSLFTHHPERILTLSQRVFKQPLPQVHIIPMQEEIHKGSMLSQKLQESIANALKNKEKIMILLNRRGYAPYIVCQACGKPYVCPRCVLSLTYHKDKRLRCHRCDFETPLTHTCPACKKPRLGFLGMGIQKVEAELHALYPEAHISRLDRDNAKTAKQIHTLMQTFKDSGDILIGTQMIAKGHHIEEVTLVGILGIDTTLNIPDFSAPERAFQLITQVAGRAGRGSRPGKVIVQTLQPEHYAIQHASTHDFLSFYEEELSYRKALAYPPFSELINIILSSKLENTLKKTAGELSKDLQKKFLGLDIRIMGPKPAPIEKIKDHFRWNILLKFPHEKTTFVKAQLQTLSSYPKAVRIIIDFEPRTVL